MANDDTRSREARENAQTERTGGFGRDDREATLPTRDLDPADAPDLDDDRDAALLRAIAHAPPRRPPSAVAPGSTWGEQDRYVVERRLGRGGMGTVYAAMDSVLNRLVALKILDVADPDPVSHARLVREARTAAQVEHERIARVYDVGSHDGFPFVAMEYVPGGTLRQWMAHAARPLAQIVDVATQIAEGLAELHGKGVVHRDLKPENVMRSAQGGIKLVDFGLARHALHGGEPSLPFSDNRSRPADNASTAASSGTPGYMAPEQCTGQPIDARADIFALGVILFEMIAQAKPFGGRTIGAIVDATLEGVQIPSDGAWASVPARLREHVARMLEPEPANRFDDGAAAVAALREVAPGLAATQRAARPGVAAQVSGRAPTERASRSRSPVVVDVGMATRGLELPIALTAFVVLVLAAFGSPAESVAAAPPGMVRIKGGTLDVGQHAWDLERECRDIGPQCIRWYLYNEVPRTQVVVKPFFLDRHEVTNAQFVEFLNEYSSLLTVFDDDELHYPRFVRENAGVGEHLIYDLYAKHSGIEYVDHDVFRVRPGQERLPAVQMTWYAAGLYCARKGYRLATENEWEAAARGQDDRRFPWGDALPRCGQVAIADGGWIPGKQNCVVPELSVPVGTMAQDVTPEGVRDLGGNVSEWTASWFVEGNRAARPTTAPRDAMRVIRGGSWSGSMMARTSGRDGMSPAVIGPNIGFRCASNLEDAAQ